MINKTATGTAGVLVRPAGEAINSADTLLLAIREYKKTAMREFLGFDWSENEQGEIAVESSWRSIPLSDAAETPDGIAFGRDDLPVTAVAGPAESVAAAAPGCVKNLRFNGSGCLRVPASALNGPESLEVAGADLLVVTADSDAGSSAIYPVFSDPCALGPGMARIRADACVCEPFYLLNILHFYYHLGIMPRVVSPGRMDLSRKALQSLPVPVPPIDDQKRITGLMLALSGGIVAVEQFKMEIEKIAIL
jgi:hypothetical protein